jgi:predicted DNA binding CopG/RHH family protein
MKEREFGWSWMEDEYVPGKPRTEHEFKESFRRAAVAQKPWTEAEFYREWAREQKKNVRISFRISSTDVMKLKALARIRGTKFRTYVTEVLKREISSEEERLANLKIKRQARGILAEEDAEPEG